VKLTIPNSSAMLPFTVPNPDFGYETTIKMPFHFSKLGNGKISAYDEGIEFDSYSVKCSSVMPIGKFNEFYATYDIWGRGSELVVEECHATGFYPFSPAILSSDAAHSDRYRIILANNDDKGPVDLLAKGFRVNFDMLLVYEELVSAESQVARSEGSMALSASVGSISINGVRYPINGFSPSVGYNVYSRQMLGGRVETVNYDYYRRGREPKNSSFTITANQATATDIIKALVFSIRSGKFTISAPRGYYLFGSRRTEEYDVRLNSTELKVRHTRFDEFEINLNVAVA